MANLDATSTTTVALQSSGTGNQILGGSASTQLQLVSDVDLVDVAYITSVVALTSERLRVFFNKPLDNNIALSIAASYEVSGAIGAVIPSVLSVEVPDTPAPLEIDLIISEMTDGESYNLAVVSIGITRNGTPVAGDLFAFTGVGTPPTLLIAVATSSTTAEIRFSEQMRDSSVIRDAATYSADNGLTISEVISFSQNIATVRTSEQDPSILYTVTVDGTLFDLANNQYVTPANTVMLGFQPVPASVDSLKLSAFNFLPLYMREDDKRQGNDLLKRFIQGFQEVWSAINQGLLDIPKLWDLSSVPASFLQYQEPLLGWTGEFADIPGLLDDDSRRRLDGNSVAFWKTRGPETTIESIIRLATGARAQVINYFDFRWVVGETHFGEEHDQDDPWTISNSPFDREDITYGTSASLAGTAQTAQSLAISTGTSNCLVVFASCRDGRTPSGPNPTPFNSMSYDGIKMYLLGRIYTQGDVSGSDLFIEVYWIRGVAGKSANLTWSVTAVGGETNFGWAVHAQAVNDFVDIRASVGKFLFNVDAINDTIESNTESQCLSVCSSYGGSISVVSPTEERIAQVSPGSEIRSIVGVRAGQSNVTGFDFSQASAGTMGIISIIMLGKPVDILSGGEQEYHVRVVDDGTLNRDVVRRLCQVTRPMGERVDILYIAFLDRFIVDGDKSQWTDELGTSVVSGGVMTLPSTDATTSTYVSVTNSEIWSEYAATWRLKGDTSFDVLFYRTDEDEHYFARFTTAATASNGRGHVELFSRASAIDTSLTTLDFPDGLVMPDDVYVTVRVVVVRVGATNNIKIYVDNTLLISQDNAAHIAGTIGQRRQNSTSGGDLVVDDTEVFFLPAETDFIDINE